MSVDLTLDGGEVLLDAAHDIGAGTRPVKTVSRA